MQQQYVRKLLGFDFTIEYKSGSSNKVADALSRIYEEVESVQSAFMALSMPIPHLLEAVRSECTTDPELIARIQRVQTGDEVTNFSIRDGILLYKNRYCIGSDSELKNKIPHEFHALPSAGHCGVKRMMVRLSSLFYWKFGRV